MSPDKSIKIKSENTTFIRNNGERCTNEVTYLAQEMEKKEELSTKNIRKLLNLKVNLRHEVPPQHKIETCAGSHAPSSSELQLFQSLSVLKKGSYAPEEDEIIIRNWKAFCKMHGWKKRRVKPFMFFRHERRTYIRSKEARRKFVQFLADDLPHRTLYSVYHRFRNLHSSHLQRRYNTDEDDMIINHIEKNPYLNHQKKFVHLAKVLNRTRASVWRRYRLLKKKALQNEVV